MGCCGVGHLPCLDGHEDGVGLLDGRWVSGGADGVDGEVPLNAPDAKTVTLHGPEVLATGDERYVTSGLDETAAEIAPNRAGAKDYDVHR